jgi:VWFA-related protein
MKTICAIVVAGLALLAQDPQQPPVFRTGTSVVAVDVAVRDKSRRPIADLKAPDFVVQDNGVRQTVDQVTYAKRPIDVTVALDVSGSVTGLVLERLRQGVTQLMRDLRDVDRLKLVLFNTQVYRASDFTSDLKTMEAAMRNVPAGGATALLDTLSVELVAARDPERRQLIVVFTDGGDSGSVTSKATIQTLAERARATVTFVTTGTVQMMLPQSVFGVTVSANSAAAPTSILARLAHDTGGDVIPVDATTSLASVFKKVLDDFRSSYVLMYSPAGVDKAGFHTISVEVTRPNAVVQARRGYFGG